MPKVKYVGMIKKSGTVGNETYVTLASGKIILKSHSEKKPVQNSTQKTNVSGFTALVPHTSYLKLVFHESFPPDSKGVKGGNRFTSLNKKNKEVVTTTKNDPDTEVDPKKKSIDEFTSVIAWEKVIMAEGPLWTPSVTISKMVMTKKDIAEFKNEQRGKASINKQVNPGEKDGAEEDEVKKGEVKESDVKEGELYKLMFSQEGNIFEGAYAYANDKVFAIVYEPESHFTLLVKLKDRGNAGSSTATIPGTIPSEKLKIYTFAKAANGKITSNSTYLTIDN